MMIQSYFLMIVWFFSLPVSASLQQGKDFGNKMLSHYGDLAVKVKPADVLPHYTPNPKETGLNESTLDKNVVETMKTHPSARLVKESEEKRGKHFKIHEDPMVLFSKEISQDPLALLSRFYKNCKEVVVEGNPVRVETESRTCEETGEPYPLTCTKNLMVTPPLKTKKYAYTHIFGKQFRRSGRNYGQIVSQTRGPRNVGHDRWYDYKQTTFIPDQKINYFDGCNYYPHTVKNYYTYEKKIGNKNPVTITESEYLSKTLKPEDVLETWTSTCDLLEEKVDSGLCIYTDKKCTQGSATRLINGFSVTKPCWQETFTYQCSVPSKNDCDILRNRGCHQTHSKCQQFIGKTCVLYTQTFTCSKPSSQKGSGIRTKIVCGDAPQCFSGDCVEQGYSLNTEMLQAVSQMSILKELQNQVKNGIPEIFKGEDNRCTRNIADFRDCCGSDGGWGTSLNLAPTCSLQEKELKLKRKNKQCRRIGTYCSRKVLGLCVEKTTTFCCFGSSFLRTLQEQARDQIRLGWGSTESPVCRGLTVEELSKVDFSKLDLREIFQEISARYKQPQNAVMSQKIQSRMNEIQESLKKDATAKQGNEG